MKKYYTRACNFYYGTFSRELVKKKLTLPLCGNKNISFDKIELISREKKKIKSKVIDLRKIHSLHNSIKKKIKFDIRKITLKRKFFNQTNIMGIINMTPDSFSDGG
jgi:dihydropteroate synthase